MPDKHSRQNIIHKDLYDTIMIFSGGLLLFKDGTVVWVIWQDNPF